MASIVQTMDAFRKNYVLLAPTGRASQVLSNYSGLLATTIHKEIYVANKFGSQKFQLNPQKHSDTLFVDGNVVYLDNGEPLVYRPLEVQLDLTGTTYEKTAGARMAKYEIDRTAHADGKLQENDIVLFRYADVVLMKAEALMRLGEDGSALFNTVRQRSGMPERELNEQTLLDERLMELQWEGWRRQDLIRFDRFHRAYVQRTPSFGESSRYTTVFPFPGSALDLNNNLTQNWGYE